VESALPGIWSIKIVRNRRDLNRATNRELDDRQPEPDRPPRVENPRCPWCGSRNTVRIQRGFVGPTDERNQFLQCNHCDRATYEIVSRTARDMRVGQFRVGGTWRDIPGQTKYTITRILKVGMNESLLYVKPLIRPEQEPPHDPGSH
jgi:hypothetical protein